MAKLKQDDEVIVIAGKDKGKRGTAVPRLPLSFPAITITSSSCFSFAMIGSSPSLLRSLLARGK